MADCKYCTGVSYVFVEFPVINSSYIIDDLQEIGKSPMVKHRFTMCCRMGTIACI